MKTTTFILGLIALTIFLMCFVTGCNLFKKSPEVILLSPPNGSTIDLTVSFSWEIKNSGGKTFRTEVITDKGTNPFDGWVEDIFNAGVGTYSLTVTLSENRYGGQSFEWGVRIWDGDKSYVSNIWKLEVK